jgi:hypothetical protein
MTPFNYAPFAWPRAFLQGLAAQGIPLGGYVMHSYNNDGGGGWKVPGFLAQTGAQVAGVRGALDAAGHGALPLWCGECGPHNGGGLENITTRAISTFWYTHALHALPLLGAQAGFNRQTLAGDDSLHREQRQVAEVLVIDRVKLALLNANALGDAALVQAQIDAALQNL